jgi:hypothetical protein
MSKYILMLMLDRQQKVGEAEQLLEHPVRQQQKISNVDHEDMAGNEEQLPTIELANEPKTPFNPLTQAVHSRLNQFFIDSKEKKNGVHRFSDPASIITFEPD